VADEAVEEEDNEVVFAEVHNSGSVKVACETEEIKKLRLQMEINQQQLQLNEQQLRLVEEQRAAERERQEGPQRGEPASNRNAGVSSNSRDVRGLLPRMSSDENDVVAFFNAFERVLEMNEVPYNEWSRLLAPYLTPKAARVYSRLSLDQCKEYSVVKEHILKAYNLTQKSYWESFKKLSRQGSESYTLFANRLTDTLNYYIESKQIDEFDSLKQDLVFQQFIESLNRVPFVKNFVLERNPSDLEAACAMADLCFEVTKQRGMHQNATPNGVQNFRPGVVGGGRPMAARGANTFGGQARNGPTVNRGQNGNQGNFRGQGQPQGQNFENGRPRVSCYWCGSRGHKTVDHRSQNQVGWLGGKLDPQRRYVVPAYVNRKNVCALRDTGANITCVNADFVHPKDVTLETENLCGAFGNVQEFKIAWVEFRAPVLGLDRGRKIKVAVIRGLQPDMLIGNQLFTEHEDLADIIQPRVETTDVNRERCDAKMETGQRAISELIEKADRKSTVSDTHQEAGFVIESGEIKPGSSEGQTSRHQQAAAETDTAETRPREQGAPPDVEHINSGEPQMEESRNDAFTEAKDKGRQTDEIKTVSTRTHRYINQESEKSKTVELNREAKFRPTDRVCDTENDTAESEFRRMAEINLATEESDKNVMESLHMFANEQRRDKGLKHWFTLCEQGNERFCLKNEILYMKAPSWKLDTHDTLLVLPESRQIEVIRSAHDSLTGAHLGGRKVYDRIAKVFVAPRLRQKVTKYIKSCKICQLVADKRLSDRVPLQPIPVVGEPFSDLVTDVIGKLPRTASGIEYVLTIVCHSTRWVSAVPLRNLKVTTIADALIKFQLTHGFAKRIRFDKFASLTSGMMKELQRTLGIEVVYANVLHHETIGLVERANRTLEKMIKSFVQTHEKQWDKLLDYFCFAINDTENATTHYAPSYLVYGRRWRGLLEIMRDAWTTGEMNAPDTEIPVYLYIERLKQRLKIAAEEVQQFAAIEQARYKHQFDKSSTERELMEGDLVLIFQPTSTHKILNKLDGPYVVTKKLNKWNYEVNLGHRKATFHINSLRKFIEREESVGLIITPQDADDQFELNQETSDNKDKVKLGSQLTLAQRLDVEKLIEQFGDVFSSKLGCTDLTQHVIKVTDETPITRPAYKVPRAIEEQLDEEIGRLLEQGVIEPASTAWTTGVVPVIKNEGGETAIRVTCDFRALNSRTVGDAYPMQNPAEILSSAAGAKWMSKIDIRKAFFQIPMAEGSEQYTGFRTNTGLYVYKRMAMGLKNSPKTMQRLMDAILRGCHKFAHCHVDDIVIHTASQWTEHLSHLKEVLFRLRNAGLTVNVGKCEIAMPELVVLGHKIKEGTIGVDDSKVEAIKRLASPTTKREVRQILGLLGYYMKLVPNFAGIAGPLTDLLKKNNPDRIVWTQKLQIAFEQLKAALTSKPVLCAPNFGRDFLLQTDASQFAIAAILSQRDQEGQERVIAYASRKLAPREINYSTVMKETLAIVWAANHFESWIYGQKVICQSDHRPLAWLESMRNTNARLMRWSLFLQRFNLEHSFRRGVENANADSLTRLKWNQENSGE
jgi:hypothetical protein